MAKVIPTTGAGVGAQKIDIWMVVEALDVGDASREAYAERVLARLATALAKRDGGNTEPRFEAIEEWAKRSAAELDQLLKSTSNRAA